MKDITIKSRLYPVLVQYDDGIFEVLYFERSFIITLEFTKTYNTGGKEWKLIQFLMV